MLPRRSTSSSEPASSNPFLDERSKREVVIVTKTSSLDPARIPVRRTQREKVLLLSANFPPQHGGSGRWLWEVYRRFPKEDVVMVAGECAGANAFDRTHNRHVVRAGLASADWGVLSRRGASFYWRAFKQVKSIARTLQVHEVHCACLLPEGYVAWLLHKFAGLPYRCFVHGEELNVVAQSRQLTFLARRVVGSAQGIIANSHNTKRLLVERWRQPPRTVCVLHPGVDAQRFTPVSPDERQRRRLGWEGRSVVLTAGRLQKRKGQDTMIRALPRVAAEVPHVLYAIAGDGEERAALEQLTAQLGMTRHVQFLGAITDDQLIACYQQCDIFVLANREVEGDFEGFGMVLLEAQACGKPVIAGQSGGTAETLRPGVTGYVIPCEEPGHLAKKVTELLQDTSRRSEMGRAGRQWVVQHFDWAVLTAQANELLMPSLRPQRYSRKMAPSP